jgi:hypothetical protein
MALAETPGDDPFRGIGKRYQKACGMLVESDRFARFVLRPLEYGSQANRLRTLRAAARIAEERTQNAEFAWEALGGAFEAERGSRDRERSLDMDEAPVLGTEARPLHVGRFEHPGIPNVLKLDWNGKTYFVWSIYLEFSAARLDLAAWDFSRFLGVDVAQNAFKARLWSVGDWNFEGNPVVLVEVNSALLRDSWSIRSSDARFRKSLSPEAYADAVGFVYLFGTRGVSEFSAYPDEGRLRIFHQGEVLSVGVPEAATGGPGATLPLRYTSRFLRSLETLTDSKIEELSRDNLLPYERIAIRLRRDLILADAAIRGSEALVH